MKRQFRITDESNRHADYFAIRELQRTSCGNVWPCVAWRHSRAEAECEALRLGELIQQESDHALPNKPC
jgi:hypothetical protein